MKKLLASLLFATSLPAMAQIYTYTDAQGNTAYTNDPPDNVAAQPVNLPPTNTVADTPDNSSEDQPATAPTSTPTASSADSSDEDSSGGGGDAYDNQQELRDDVDVRRAAAIDAATPGPARIDTPAVDAVVPGPGKIEEGVRR